MLRKCKLALSTILALLVIAGTAAVVPIALAKHESDDIKFAMRIHKFPFEMEGLDTTNYTKEIGEPQPRCLRAVNTDVSQSVWFRVDMKEAGYYEWTTAGSTYDTVITLYQATSPHKGFDGLRGIECNDDNWLNQTTLQGMFWKEVKAGTYYVQVGDFGSPTLTQPHTTNLAIRKISEDFWTSTIADAVGPQLPSEKRP